MTSNMGYELVPITKIRCFSCKHFKELKDPAFVAICTAHGDFLRAYEWVEFAKNCKEYEAK